MSRFEAEKKLSVKEQAASELAAELATMRARFTSQYHLNSDFLFYEANLIFFSSFDFTIVSKVENYYFVFNKLK